MLKARSVLLELIAPIVIVFAWFLIISSTVAEGTVLSGWDNLHPEFNISANIARSLNAVWQEYQGVGILGGMAHAADLPRQLLFTVLSFVVPREALRYVWVFGMLLLGPLGGYLLARHITRNNFAALAGGLLYLLNMSTVQTFFVPFESFITFYGYLPFFIYLAILYLKKAKKRYLLYYSTALLLGATAFYIQTHFVVFIMLLSLFIVEYCFSKQQKLFSSVIKLGIITALSTAFWSIPVAYFTFSGSEVFTSAKTSILPTAEVKLMNQGFGDPENIILMRGFWLEYSDELNGEFNYLMPFWREYVSTDTFEIIGIGIFAISLAGFLFGAFLRRNRWELSLFAMFILSFLMLTAGEGALGVVYNTMSRAVPLFGQMFRSVFTKWSTAYALSFALGAGLFVAYISKLVKKYTLVNAFIFCLLISVLAALQLRPLFKGHLISNSMQVKYPEEYFSLFEYFRSQPREARIARFPVQTFWGWDFYDWGYRGSGFLWYGIEQPILDRAFDVWSKYNEGYYHEISTALYREDKDVFKKVLDKYDVTHALIDKSVIVPEGNPNILRFKETENLLSQIGAKKVWEKGFLAVYKVSSEDSFVYAPETYISADIDLDYAKHDPVYMEYGNYVSSKKFVYPFGNLLREEPHNIKVKPNIDGSTFLSISSQMTLNQDKKELSIPPLKNSFRAHGSVSLKDKLITVNLLDPVSFENVAPINFFKPFYITLKDKPRFIALFINGKVTNLIQGERKELIPFLLDPNKALQIKIYETPGKISDISFFDSEFVNCWQRENKKGSFNIEKSDSVLVIKVKDMVACSSQKIGNLKKDSLLKIALPHRSDSGAKPHFCVVKEGESECIHEEIFYKTPTSKDWELVEREMIVPETANYWLVLAARPPDEAGTETTIFYRPINISLMDKTADITFSNSNWDKLINELKIPIGDIDNLTLNIPTKEINTDFINGGLQREKNCDLFQRGGVSKKVNDNKVIYIAEERAASCDYSILGYPAPEESFVLRIRGKNKEGRSLKAYLYNPATQKNDLEVLLSPNSFDNYFSILSWPFESKDNYTLNLETRSFGRKKSINEVDLVATYSVPLEWLAKIKIVNNDQEIISSGLEITRAKKFGTALYKAEVAGEGIVALSQGYDSGWVAFSINNWKIKALPHFKLNSWANAWQIPNPDYQLPTTIYIIYLPQLLQWIGFLLLPLTFLLLLL